MLLLVVLGSIVVDSSIDIDIGTTTTVMPLRQRCRCYRCSRRGSSSSIPRYSSVRWHYCSFFVRY